MLLKTVLHVNEINRNTYNTLERRTPGGFPFMKRGLAEGKRDDRYNVTHAVALAAMLNLHAMGVEAKDAAEVIDAVYDVLIDWVPALQFNEALPAHATDEVDPDKTWITVSRFEDGGLGWATGKEDANTFSADPPLDQRRVNVAAIVKKLWPRIQPHLKAPDVQRG